jgi:hypothetical protein
LLTERARALHERQMATLTMVAERFVECGSPYQRDRTVSLCARTA